MSSLNLKQLEVFAAVVEYGSFTEAAEHLYIAQSTVSTHISALEEALQTTLFERSSKKHTTLTSDGKRVYQYAKDIIDKCGMLECAHRREYERALVIGASSAPSKSLLPEQIRIFSEQHPECCCTVKSGGSEQIQQMVLDGDIQLGFVGSTDNRQSLRYECISEDHLVMITPNTPRFAALHSQGALGKDLLGEPLIFRSHGSGTQKMIDNYLSTKRINGTSLHIRHYVSDPALLQELVISGCGVSILSALSVQEQVRSGALLAFELDDPPVYRNIYMVCRRKNDLSDLAKEFVKQVRGEQL